MAATTEKIIYSIKEELSKFIKKSGYSSCFIICDTNTLHFCLSKLILSCKALKDAEVIELEPGEESKELAVIENIIATLTELGADRSALVINLGGGVVSDTGGFAASVYKRGVDFINIPTTLLAMADASVGGKTGINFSGIKNQIGTITQPAAVFIHQHFLTTLPYRHLINGYAEILKMAIISDKKLFNKLSKLVVDESFSNRAIIAQSIKLKSLIVKKDPNEKSLRKILNFGHSIGHALESVYLTKEDPLLHGEAVAVGMAIEAYISFLLKRIKKKELELIVQTIRLNFDLLAIADSEFDLILSYLKHDKKNKNQILKFALLKSIGKCEPDVAVTPDKIRKALSFYNEYIANASSVQ